VAFEPVDLRPGAACKLDVDDVVALIFVDVAIDAVRKPPQLVLAGDDAFIVKEAGDQLEVGAGRAHRDRNGAGFATEHKPNLEGLFGRYLVKTLTRRAVLDGIDANFGFWTRTLRLPVYAFRIARVEKLLEK
jgi:hypothetical protein